MAYIQITDWSLDQVTEWLKGLNSGSPQWLQSMSLYRTSFTNNQINGNRLLNLRPYELEELGIRCIGHQEIILEALEVLKNFHFNLDKENLQYLALNVATSAHSLFRQLQLCNEDHNRISTDMLKETTRTISYIKRLVDWIDKPPFYKQTPFNEIREQMLKLGLEIATCAQREIFTQNPVLLLQQKTEKLTKLANWVIQNISDPMLLQPSTLDLVTLKKRESELGFYILPSVYGVHKITQITYNSPAHNSNKIEEGDEIVQINYQTVVGWNRERVLYILRESPPDVLLTIRKRPKHTKMYGQIYIKPYRLPSKKRSHPYRWGENIPSPRGGDFLNTHDFFPCLKSLPEKQLISDSELSSDEDPPIPPKRINNFYKIKIHRRHSICCDGYSMVKFLLNRSTNSTVDQGRLDDSPSLRDKSVSFGFGLEATGPRPSTHIGITVREEVEEKPKLKERKTSTAPKPAPRLSSGNGELEGISKVVRFDSSAKLNDSHVDTQYTCNVENTVLETFVPIPYADDEESSEAALDKPPAIEPRQDKKKPIPPPRPSKKISLPPVTLPTQDQFEPPSTPTLTPDDKRAKIANVVDLRKTKVEAESPVSVSAGPAVDPLELLIQTNTSKNLTLKKKNSLISKRRKAKVSQLAASSDIQGHLYRRTKNRQGASYWAKLYVLLIDTALYGFRTKTATKAICLIFLPGFTVTKAKEVHSKSHAFKVYHPKKTFYFAAETEEAQKQWIDFINQATMKAKSLTPRPSVPDHDLRELFSETDSSDDENLETSFHTATPSPLLSSASNSAGKKNDSTPTSSRLGFGSLKKSLKNLNSPSDSSSDSKFLSIFSSSSRSAERKNSIDVPVPTSQFKSYRKMPLNVNLQTGVVSIQGDELPPPSPKIISSFDQEEPIFDEVIIGEVKQIPPKSPPKPSYNYMHASNPNLLDFQSCSVPKPATFEFIGRVTSRNESLGQQATTWEGSQSLTGFVTLKDLMLQKQADDAKEMYNKRVCLGIEKTDERMPSNRKPTVAPKPVFKNEEKNLNNEVRSKINKIQLRSLPVTPDYAQSFKPDDQDILYTRSRDGQKLRDFGYELITGDDRVELKNNLAAVQEAETASGGRKKTNKVAAVDTKKRTITWIGSSGGAVGVAVDKNGTGMKKTKNKSGVIEKFDHLVASSEKLFHFRQHSANETENLKTKLPTSKPCVVSTNWNLVENPQGMEMDKTGSYFTKLSFANRSAKEKKLLGSPRLHRAIFGSRNNHGQDQADSSRSVDHEIFLPLSFTKNPTSESAPMLNNAKPSNIQVAEASGDTGSKAPPGAQGRSGSVSGAGSPSDYPNMEYPPIFEAEIYSLSDLSSNLLKRRHQNIEK